MHKQDATLAKSLSDKYYNVESLIMTKLDKSSKQLFVQAIAAGMFISLAFIFYITITAAQGAALTGMVKLVGGLGFSIGLILIVIFGVELFTSSILLIAGYVNGKLSLSSMIKNWSLVYLGNAVGAAFMVLLIVLADIPSQGGGVWGLHTLNIAEHKLHHSQSQAITLGILCNLLVCLAILMAYHCRSITEKVLVIAPPVALFVSSGFEHSIANMFIIPTAVTIKSFAETGFWLQIDHTAAQFADLTLCNFLLDNLVPVTIGNILGGALVAIGFYRIHKA